MFASTLLGQLQTLMVRLNIDGRDDHSQTNYTSKLKPHSHQILYLKDAITHVSALGQCSLKFNDESGEFRQVYTF